MLRFCKHILVTVSLIISQAHATGSDEIQVLPISDCDNTLIRHPQRDLHLAIWQHGENFGTGLGSLNPETAPPAWPYETIMLLRQFQRAINKADQEYHLVKFEVYPTYVGEWGRNQYLYEYPLTPVLMARVIISADKDGADARRPDAVRALVVFVNQKTGLQLTQELMYRGRGSYTSIGRAKSNPVVDRGTVHNFYTQHGTQYVLNSQDLRTAGLALELRVSDDLARHPMELTLKAYALK